MQRVSLLRNPQNINLVSSSVVKDLRREIEPCERTVEIYGSVMDIKGSVVLQWSFEGPGEQEKLPKLQRTRFYVPNVANPIFDATFSEKTARKHGIS